ncbi:MAG: TPM domain-containing protein [Clostridia bacterium]|nr:TPM domain-containing protein [Clostridia bacterium]
MMKRSLLILMTALLILVLALPALAAHDDRDPVLMDRADLLTPEEETRITDKILHFVTEKNCHILIITDTIFYDSNYDLAAELNSLYSRDLIILTVTYAGGAYFYDLFTYEAADDDLTNAEVNAILDAEGVYGNLKSGRVCDGLLCFVDETAQYMFPVIDRPEGFYLTREKVVISLGIAFAIALIACGIVVARYKMKLKPTNYPLEHYTDLRLTECKDHFVGSAVTKRRISSSSSSGASGGRSGGHRGGR